MSLTIFDVFHFAESIDLPSNKRVIVRVLICGNEGATPIYPCTKISEVRLYRRKLGEHLHPCLGLNSKDTHPCNGWEVVDPVERICESLDVFFQNSNGLHLGEAIFQSTVLESL